MKQVPALLLTLLLLVPVGLTASPPSRPAPPVTARTERATTRHAPPRGAAGPTLDPLHLAFPTVTTPVPLLVVLVGFANAPGHPTPTAIEHEYFAPTDSVAAYFRDNSYGAVALSGTVVDGQTLGLATTAIVLPHATSFYDAQGQMNGALDILRDTVAILDAHHFDWSPYEENGTIPYLSIVQALPEPSDTNSALYSAEYPGPGLSADGGTVPIENFDIVSATDPIGILAHEFGHMLNLIDLYNTSTGDYVVGDWSLYDGGAWNPDGSGSLPADIDPWQKIVMGWVHPTLITASGTYSLPAVETSGQVDEIAFPGAHEAYFLENRQPIGWDAGLPGSGLLIWKVDLSIADPAGDDWQNDVVNTTGGRGDPPWPGVQLVDADASGDLVNGGGPGDPFPGRAGVTVFSDATKPSARLLDGQPSGLTLEDIRQVNGVVTFRVVLSPTLSLSAPPHPVAGRPFAVRVLDPAGEGPVTVRTPFGTTSVDLTDGVAVATVTATSAGAATLSVEDRSGATASLTVNVSAALPYSDVPATRWYAGALASLYMNGDLDPLPGWTGPLFQAGAAVSRAEAAVLLLEAVGKTGTAPVPAKITDVPSGAWAAGAIGRVLALGLMTGTSPTTFSPDRPLTRAELAALLVRAFHLAGDGRRPPFADVPQGAWYAQDVAVAWQHGLLLGEGRLFQPAATVTRAEAVVVLARALKLAGRLP